MTGDEIEKLRQGKKEAAIYMVEKLKQKSLLTEEEINAQQQDKKDAVLAESEHLKHTQKNTI